MRVSSARGHTHTHTHTGFWRSDRNDRAKRNKREIENTGLILTKIVVSQEIHLATVIEILQSIRQADMSPILSRIYSAPGGTEALDTLMKYMYAPLFFPT